MRITTASSYATTINNLQLRQQDLSDAQTRLSSGKRVLKPSDDPAAAARAERALAAESRSEASQRSVDASKVLMTQAESALGDANELLSQVREALVAAGNASYTDANRVIQANKIQGLRDQLLQVANRSDGAG
ncbi:MAG: flagellar hook-associated protein 3, partial [Burkholderiales bacterium]